jgi:hypothetical protein
VGQRSFDGLKVLVNLRNSRSFGRLGLNADVVVCQSFVEWLGNGNGRGSEVAKGASRWTKIVAVPHGLRLLYS